MTKGWLGVSALPAFALALPCAGAATVVRVFGPGGPAPAIRAAAAAFGKRFVAFLESPQGRAIFEHYGWNARAVR